MAEVVTDEMVELGARALVGTIPWERMTESHRVYLLTHARLVLTAALRDRHVVTLPSVEVDEEGYGGLDTANGRVVGYLDPDGEVVVETESVVYDGEGAVELAVAILAVAATAEAGRAASGEDGGSRG